MGTNNVRQGKGTHAYKDGDDDQSKGDLVGHHLSRGSKGAQEGVLRVGRPSSHDHSIDTKGRDGKDVEHPHVEIRKHKAFSKGNHCPGDQSQQEGQHRCRKEDHGVGRTWKDGFLDQQLKSIGQGLKDPKEAHHIGSLPALHGSHYLTFRKGQVGHGHQKRDHKAKNLSHKAEDEDQHRRPVCMYPQRESNPCFTRERGMS